MRGIVITLGIIISAISTKGQNNPDSSAIEYIYIVPEQNTPTEAKVVTSPKEDFYRKKLLIRIDLTEEANQPLFLASPETKAEKKGIVDALITGLRKNQIKGVHPANLSQRYDYFDLIYHLLDLEGIQPGGMVDSIRMADLGWEWMHETLDLIVDQGFSSQSSKDFFRIKYLRLVWYNPYTAKGAKVIAVFPYKNVASYLEQVVCPIDSDQREISAKEFLELQLFKGIKMKIPQDPAEPVTTQLSEKQKSGIHIKEVWQN